MQSKRTAFIALAVVVLILVGASVYILSSRKSNPNQPLGQAIEVIPTIAPNEIGLDFVAKPDKKYVKFTINKPDGIEKVDYEISYDAIAPQDSSGEGGGGKVTQSLAGSLAKKDVKNGKLGIDWRELGTCSTGGLCRFDQGITSVNLILKLTKTDNKVFQVETSITL